MDLTKKQWEPTKNGHGKHLQNQLGMKWGLLQRYLDIPW